MLLRAMLCVAPLQGETYELKPTQCSVWPVGVIRHYTAGSKLDCTLSGAGLDSVQPETVAMKALSSTTTCRQIV
jgi:hypothetical protein